MANRFRECENMKTAKTLYRDLLKKNHPDVGGSEEVTKEIVAEFEEYCLFYMGDAFDAFAKERGFDANGDPRVFADILAKISKFNIRIEIMGIWIYAFESFDYKDELKDLGFFFSKKHSAWIYNGGPKLRRRSRFTTNDVRKMHGSEVIREKDDVKKLAI